MRMLVRWAFYTIGIPNLIGFVLVTGLGVILAGIIPPSRRGALLALVDFSSGVFSVFAGIFLSRMLGFQPSVFLPMLSGLWLAIHFSSKNRIPESFLASFGVVVGWFIYNWFTPAVGV